MQTLDIMYVLPELFLSFVALFLLIMGSVLKDGFAPGILKISIASLLIAIYLIVGDYNSDVLAFGGLLVINPFVSFSKILILVAAALVMMLFIEKKRENHLFFEFPILIILAVVGMMIMVSANDLMILYVGLEMQSLALYILAASNRDSEKSSEAGLKYFVLGALASGIFLFGASLIYGFTGTTNIDSLYKLYAYLAETERSLAVGVVIGMVMVIVALCFKISAVPFHMWTPDVYEGAPTKVTAFFAAVPKIAGAVIFLRVVLEAFGGLVDQWRQVVVAAAALSMILGAFAAIKQKNIKRLLAYSSIGHVGFVLTGIASASPVGVQATLVYLAIYLAMTVGTFACVLSFNRNGKAFENISELSGIAKNHPVFAFVLAALMFSMAGIPPLAGFFAKFNVLLAAVNSNLYALAIIGVLSSVVSAFYYINIIKIMYFDEAKQGLDKITSYGIYAVLVISVSFNLAFFIYPAGLLDLAKTAAAAILS